MTMPHEERSFEVADPRDARRVVRGRIDGPAGFERANPPLPHVIVVHGFKGFSTWGFFPDFAARVAREGWIAVRFDMSGSGIDPRTERVGDLEAFAHDTHGRELEDLERVRAWLASEAPRGLDPTQAALVGHSRGGAVALLHAARHPELRSLVGWAALEDVDRFDPETKAIWRRTGRLQVPNMRTGQQLELATDLLDEIESQDPRLDVLAAARRLAVPTLLLHGEEDEAVPITALERLRAVLPPGIHRVERVAATGHTFGVSHPFSVGAGNAPAWERVAHATIAWIRSHWCRAPESVSSPP